MLVCVQLEASGLESTFIFGSMDASARKINLGKFRVGKSPLMVVTDVAARGLDLPLLDNVINLHFPSYDSIDFISILLICVCSDSPSCLYTGWVEWPALVGRAQPIR